jgi:hypothetical protein
LIFPGIKPKPKEHPVKQDRFLIAILIFVLVLAAMALALFFSRQGTQDYGPEDTPEGVVRNYVLALLNKDYERAYGYLLEGENKPDYAAFRQQVFSQQIDPSYASLQIGQVELDGDEAWLGVTILRGNSGLFQEPYREPNQARLVRDEAGEWKIASMPYTYWGWDWYTPQPKPLEPPTP